MCNKIKRELYATECKCFKSNLTRPIGCRVWLSNVQKMTIKNVFSLRGYLCKNLLLRWQ